MYVNVKKDSEAKINKRKNMFRVFFKKTKKGKSKSMCTGKVVANVFLNNKIFESSHF